MARTISPHWTIQWPPDPFLPRILVQNLRNSPRESYQVRFVPCLSVSSTVSFTLVVSHLRIVFQEILKTEKDFSTLFLLTNYLKKLSGPNHWYLLPCVSLCFKAFDGLVIPEEGLQEVVLVLIHIWIRSDNRRETETHWVYYSSSCPRISTQARVRESLALLFSVESGRTKISPSNRPPSCFLASSLSSKELFFPTRPATFDRDVIFNIISPSKYY